ncbi:hypothetical protein L6164_036470 [Bauhinia variegata]|uniref:Uncharacterized protein n=1 Tax=Bauhinia variegata TaxID=167791 RepID=A0ACB9KH77_BAUVA|nr:hypothetical protein L6164_036470 [Bauhinia variegata]
MSFRNQNWPPRSPSIKKGAAEEVISDKHRRIGAERMERQGTAGGGRPPFAAVNNRPDANTASNDVVSTEGSERSIVEFTKEDVDALLNEKMKKGNTFDSKKKMEQMGDLIKRLKLCVRWFKQVEEGHIQEKENIQAALECAEKKCTDAETEMKNKIEESNNAIRDLRKTISSLEELIAKEESDRLEAIECHKKEKQARSAAEQMQASLSTELEKVRQEKLTAEQEAFTKGVLYKELQKYNISLQQYNSCLQRDLETTKRDLETTSESLKRVEREKSTIVQNLSTIRGHNEALKDQLQPIKVSRDEAIKQKELLAQELKCLREELQQIRGDRNRRVKQVEDLTEEVEKFKAITGESLEQLESVTNKTSNLEERCSNQKEQIIKLEQQLREKDKLKMGCEEQERIIHELQNRLADKEFQVIEGEKLRKKLHNTILELKGNIRVFCRVRPLLPDDGIGTDMVVSYPTSTEALGRGIELVQSGQKYSFTFDKVFNHEASQQDVFTEISQLVQSALDGYKVCIFAYGQTGSGKTYTMMGRPDASELKGLIPRSLEQIFQISQSLKDQGWKYNMQASVLEIYNETIRDLLSSNRSYGTDQTRTENGVPGRQYTIKHDANGNTHVSDLTIVDVTSVYEISSLLQQAAHSRSVGRTQMNEQSSRSHFVFTLRICGINEKTEQQVQGVLNLIDLAGSERLSRSGATGDRLKETQAINKSLSSLSDVIFALAKKEEHVPFRNSKLTYLLQPCLGGDSKTLMFVNMSPDPSSTNESLCSLRFAARVNACEIGIPRRQTSTG